MSLDMSKLKQTAQQVENMLNKGGPRAVTNFWKPKAYKNLIRVMPPWSEDGDFKGQFWREVHQHWNVAEKGPITCSAKTPFLEGSCPVCELVEEMQKDRDPEVKAAVKQIRSKVAFLLNIQDLKDPVYTQEDVNEYKTANPDVDELPFEAGDAKIQIYAAGTMVFNDIVTAVTDGGNDITDLETGNDIILNKIGSGLTTKYNVTLKVKQTPADVASDTKFPELSNVGVVRPYEKVKAMLAECESAQKLQSLSGGSSAPALKAGDEDDSYLNVNTEGVADLDDFEAELQQAARG